MEKVGETDFDNENQNRLENIEKQDILLTARKRRIKMNRMLLKEKQNAEA